MPLISEDVYDENVQPPRLVGGRSVQDGRIVFPLPNEGSGEDFDRVHLKREGTLWSYTVQRFPPGPPYVGVRDREKFEPFGLGYVELEGEVIVETHIVTDDFSSLKVGMPMVLTSKTIPGADGEGDHLMYAFKPAGQNDK